MNLSEFDRDCLAGDLGKASQFAMSILVRIGEIQSAAEMINITRAHIDSTLFQGDATLEFAERLAHMGAKVVVPTTLNVSGVDENGWQDWAVPAEWAEKAYRQMVAYQSMDTEATWTCAPYQVAEKPSFGEQIAWGESNAVAFANSVLGARTIQYPDLLDVCAAITGRVPAVGLHLTANRVGEVLLKLVDIPENLQCDDLFSPVLGHLLGTIAGDRVPVVDGITVELTEDQFKAICAGGASSGAVNLFHIVGQTPEAPTRDEAFQGRAPSDVHHVNLRDLGRIRSELDSSQGEALDMVVLGSPHFSIAEFRKLAPMLEGQECHTDVDFLVTSSRAMVKLARESGLLNTLQAFGGKVTVDTCILTTPMLFPETRRLMTNSAKYAYYSPGLLDAEVAFGSMADCVRSAITGRVRTDNSLWES
jgi:predicted aconitase